MKSMRSQLLNGTKSPELQLVVLGFSLLCNPVAPNQHQTEDIEYDFLHKPVDIVRPYYELEYVSACKELGVDIFVIGEDWGRKVHNTDVETYLKQQGKQVTQVTYNMRTSSTQIKNNVVDQTR